MFVELVTWRSIVRIEMGTIPLMANQDANICISIYAFKYMYKKISRRNIYINHNFIQGPKCMEAITVH